MSKIPVSQIEVEKIKGFPLNNRKAKVVKDRNKVRVVERHYYWNAKTGRGDEKREYIGYVVDGEYFDNAAYKKLFDKHGKRRLIPLKDSVVGETTPTGVPVDETADAAPSVLETRLAAEMPVYYAVADATGLAEDLTTVWGKDQANAILSLSFHWLNTTANAAYLFESWSSGKLLPYPGISPKETTALFEAIARTPGWRKDFFNRRINRLADGELMSFDATAIGTEANNISYAKFGHGKEGGYQKQVGLILLVGHDSKMPVLFRVLPGQITDVSTVPDMLFRFDEITDKRRVFAAVVDRGYFSLANIARFVDAGSRVIMAAKTDSEWIRDAFEKAYNADLWSSKTRIPGQKCWGVTIACEPKFADGKKRKVWVHVYRSEEKSIIENESFFESLDRFESDWKAWRPKNKEDVCPLLKSPLMKFYIAETGFPGASAPVRDHEAIDGKCRYFGLFCNVTTMECATAEALSSYHVRDLIEKTFKGGKSGAGMDVVRAHSDDVMEGRFIVGFAAMTILNEIYRQMKKPTHVMDKDGSPKRVRPLIEEMSFNLLKNKLSTPRVVFDGHGGARWMEVTKAQHEIARRLGFPDLYREIPNWAGFSSVPTDVVRKI